MYLVSQCEFKGKKYSARKLIAQPGEKPLGGKKFHRAWWIFLENI